MATNMVTPYGLPALKETGESIGFIGLTIPIGNPILHLQWNVGLRLDRNIGVKALRHGGS